MVHELDSWLTSVRVRRLGEVLAAVRSHPPPGVPDVRVVRVAWNRCDGPLNDVQKLLDVAKAAKLIEVRGGLVRLSKLGRLVATQNHQQGGRLLAGALVDAGCFRNQARRLLVGSEMEEDGGLRCDRKVAIDVAAQLTGLLRLWPGVELSRRLTVPADVVRRLLETWSLHPLPTGLDESTRSEVGDRAEAYSFLMEQERAESRASVQWVALDDDSLGYDIRDSASSPSRCIEVKGSQGAEVRFYLSAGEWRVGHELGDAYEIHFWGEILLSRSRGEEYRLLRRMGYPYVFRNLRSAMRGGVLSARLDTLLVVAEEAVEDGIANLQ